MKHRLWIIAVCLALSGCAGGGGKPVNSVAPAVKEMNVGSSYWSRGCYAKSLEFFSRAYERFVAADDISGMAMSLNNIGNVYRVLGDTESALLFFDESFALYSDAGDVEGLVQVISNKAATLIDLGKYDDAEVLLSEGDDLDTHDGKVFLPLLTNRGILYLRTKRYGDAEAVFRKGLEKAEKERPSESAALYFAMGRLMFETEKPADAIGFWNKAFSLDKAAGFSRGMADDMSGMGNAQLKIGNVKKAVGLLKRAALIYGLFGDTEKVEIIRENLEKAAGQTGRQADVTDYFIKKWIEKGPLTDPCS